jgi:hypothetical protein
MADYKELLRKAVEALPENNGAARRAVYEKARAALVGQLRAIQPPLPARDITTHRLQLEDCIRQVEQESSEAVIAGMGSQNDAPPPPVYFENTRPQPQLAKPQAQVKPAPSKPVLVPKEAPRALPQGGTIEDIIAAANADSPSPPEPPKKRGSKANGANKPIPIRAAPPPPPVSDEDEVYIEREQDVLPPKPAQKQPPARPLPAIVARAEAAKNRSNSTAFSVPGGDKPYDAPRRGPSIEPRQGLMPSRGGSAAAARQQLIEPAAFLEEPKVAAAMSAVREVEVEPQQQDPQGAIDRAIATLDREARGENDYDDANEYEEERPNGRAPKARGELGGMMGRANGAPQKPKSRGARQLALPAPAPQREAREPKPEPRRGRERGRERERDRDSRESAFESGFPRARAEAERGGVGAVTIFLMVFAVLLLGAGGAGFWAVSQGYVDLSTMFRPAVAGTQTTAQPTTIAVTADASATPATGPGNTAAPAEQPAPTTELATEDRLTPDPALTGTQPLALAATTAPAEERLPTDAASAASAEAAVAAVDPTNAAGSQSLLLEASDSGTTGAVPFSGTVDWSKGQDETGQPTLIGKASIPARNMGVDVLIRKNSDPQLPASHLMEISFRVSDGFIGGSIAGVPGVLLKNEELVQGTPLVGASARIVGNQFLFALSASPEDLTNNAQLLVGRKWMDLALIYATGKRAIITLEKDPAAESLFNEVFQAWGQTASN